MSGNPCNIIPDQEIVLEGGAKLVPAADAADNGKVLGVVNASGDIGWVDGSSGATVDQTYNASSTNAQSGTAVAEAVGTPVNLLQGFGITLSESNGGVTISANESSSVSGVVDSGFNIINFELPSGQYLAPGDYLVSAELIPTDYDGSQKLIGFGPYGWVPDQNVVRIPWNNDGPFGVSYQVFATVSVTGSTVAGFSVALFGTSMTSTISPSNIVDATLKYKLISAN